MIHKTEKKRQHFPRLSFKNPDKDIQSQEEDIYEERESCLLSSHFKTFNVTYINPSISTQIRLLKSEAHNYTTKWLIDQAKSKLEAFCLQKEIILFKSFDQNFTLQTKSKQIMYDYLLSIPESTLDKFPDKIKLVPFFLKSIDQSSNQVTTVKSKKTCIGDFDVYAKLGKGGFSTVFVGRKRDTGRIYAIKQIKKGRRKSKSFERQSLKNEKDILMILKESLRVKLHYAFQTKRHYYLVLDYLPGGSLRSLITKRRGLLEEQAKIYVAEAVSDLIIIQSKNIIYRDLKSDNILLDSEGHLHLTDFGTSKIVDPKNPFARSTCGTQETMAPEVIHGGGYSYTADYYSLGVLTYELVCGNPPFYRKNTDEDILNRVLTEVPNYPTHVSEEMEDFMKKLLIKDPAFRLGAKGYHEILNHPWLSGIDFKKIRARDIPPPLEIFSHLKDLRYKTTHQMDLTKSDDEMKSPASTNEEKFGFTYETEERQDLKYKEITSFRAFSELKPDFARSPRSYRVSHILDTTQSPRFSTNFKTIRKTETSFLETKTAKTLRSIKFSASDYSKQLLKRPDVFLQIEESEVPSDIESKISTIKTYRLNAKVTLEHLERRKYC